jgi:TetR/AcrR family transcriptional repressor of nem operon
VVAPVHEFAILDRSVQIWQLIEVARTKEFDRDAALESAMQTFWSKGYAATSLDDLTAAMNIGRQSIYDTFGNKRELFDAALERYAARSELGRACLVSDPSPLRAIRTVFEALADEPIAVQRKGCLGIHALLELAPTDPASAKKTAAGHRKIEQQFFLAIERGKLLGEIPNHKDSRALARFLVGAYSGLRVVATAEPHGPIVRDMIRTTLEVLT